MDLNAESPSIAEFLRAHESAKWTRRCISLCTLLHRFAAVPSTRVRARTILIVRDYKRYVRGAILFSKLTCSVAPVNPYRREWSPLSSRIFRPIFPFSLSLLFFHLSRRGGISRLLYDDGFGNKLVVNSADNSSKPGVNLH